MYIINIFFQYILLDQMQYSYCEWKTVIVIFFSWCEESYVFIYIIASVWDTVSHFFKHIFEHMKHYTLLHTHFMQPMHLLTSCKYHYLVHMWTTLHVKKLIYFRIELHLSFFAAFVYELQNLSGVRWSTTDDRMRTLPRSHSHESLYSCAMTGAQGKKNDYIYALSFSLVLSMFWETTIRKRDEGFVHDKNI